MISKFRAQSTAGAGGLRLPRRRLMLPLPAPLHFRPTENEHARAAASTPRRPTPLKIKLTPSSVPMTHSLLDGHVDQIAAARKSMTTPLNTSQAEAPSRRKCHARTNSRIACMER